MEDKSKLYKRVYLIGVLSVVGLFFLGYNIRQSTVKREQAYQDSIVQIKYENYKKNFNSREARFAQLSKAVVALELNTTKNALDSLYRLGNNSSAYFSGEINFLEQKHNTLLRIKSYVSEFESALYSNNDALMDKWAKEINAQLEEMKVNENRFRNGKYKKR